MAPTALFCWRLEHAHPELPSTRLTFALCWPQFPSGCCWFNVSNFKFLERKTASFPPACQFGGNIICPVALPDGGGCCWKKFISFFGWCREEDGLCLWYDQELWDLGMSCQPIRAGRCVPSCSVPPIFLTSSEQLQKTPRKTSLLLCFPFMCWEPHLQMLFPITSKQRNETERNERPSLRNETAESECPEWTDPASALQPPRTSRRAVNAQGPGRPEGPGGPGNLRCLQACRGGWC